jgi:hypothetical protein
MDGIAPRPSPVQALQAEHERLLGRLGDVGGVPSFGPTPPAPDQLPLGLQALIHEARAYIERGKVEAEWVSDARDRSQLRANLRFWASFLLSCTGVYPDTTLRPARPYQPQPYRPVSATVGLDLEEPISERSSSVVEPPQVVASLLGQEEQTLQAETSEEDEESPPEGAVAPSRPSNFWGLVAILIVGVIPLAAVCLALSLFYNLDERNPWALPVNAATRTAAAAVLLPSPTPLASSTRVPASTPTLPHGAASGFPPQLSAQVTLVKTSASGKKCLPVLILSLDAPVEIGGAPIRSAEVAVYQAGSEEPVGRGLLAPGAAALTLNLKEAEVGQKNRDWLVQVEHPWLDVEAIILAGSLFDGCVQNQVTITYGLGGVGESWGQAPKSPLAGDLGLRWRLLTWGPDALQAGSWVAAVKLQASGGDGNYVYYARGDLALPGEARPANGLLPGDQVLLSQKQCTPVTAQIGVTSGGQSFSRRLALRPILPECR